MSRESRVKIELHTPIDDADILRLHVGDTVLISGVVVTARDVAHKWLSDNFITHLTDPTARDKEILEQIKPILHRGVIYHCGPVVSGINTQQYRFVAAGPTTSIREEQYQADVMELFNLKGIIGKGGMGKKTLEACARVPAVYLHVVGGAAAFIAERVKEVIEVYHLDFGIPEAMWAIRVEGLPAVVTMDSHLVSLHKVVREESREVLNRLIG